MEVSLRLSTGPVILFSKMFNCQALPAALCLIIYLKSNPGKSAVESKLRREHRLDEE